MQMLVVFCNISIELGYAGARLAVQTVDALEHFLLLSAGIVCSICMCCVHKHATTALCHHIVPNISNQCPVCTTPAAWIYMFAKSVAHVDEFAAESLTSTYWLAFTAMRTSAVSAAMFCLALPTHFLFPEVWQSAAVHMYNVSTSQLLDGAW